MEVVSAPIKQVTLAQIAQVVRVAEVLDLYLDDRVLWTDDVVPFVWHGRTLTYRPRLARVHVEPIEDEL